MSSRRAYIAALPREIGPLVNGWHGDEDLLERKIYLHWKDRTIVACAGMGARRVSLAVEAVLIHGPVSELVSVGWAGACNPVLKVGDIVRPAAVIDAKTGERFTQAEGQGTLVSSDSFALPAEKQRLLDSYRADAVDMEAATVARLAAARGLPFWAIKAISDAADFDLPGLGRFSTPDGRFREAAFAVYALVHPRIWGPVLSMARNSKLAVTSLVREIRHEAEIDERG